MSHQKPIRILLVDDHRVVHQALAEMISFIEDFELVGHASNGQEAIVLCQEHVPDVVLMDVVMPGIDGVQATRRILGENPLIKILALSSFQDDVSVNSMLKTGAVGYVLKNTPVDRLESIIRTVYEGKSVIDSQLMKKIVFPDVRATPGDVSLSNRELEILKMVASGMSYNAIADCLGISLSTVKFHIGNILSKLKVDTRSEAIVVATKNGII